jgi:hypothetical protein
LRAIFVLNFHNFNIKHKGQKQFYLPFAMLGASCSMLENSKHGQEQNNISFQTTMFNARKKLKASRKWKRGKSLA